MNCPNAYIELVPWAILGLGLGIGILIGHWGGRRAERDKYSNVYRWFTK